MPKDHKSEEQERSHDLTVVKLHICKHEQGRYAHLDIGQATYGDKATLWLNGAGKILVVVCVYDALRHAQGFNIPNCNDTIIRAVITIFVLVAAYCQQALALAITLYVDVGTGFRVRWDGTKADNSRSSNLMHFDRGDER